MGFDRWALDFIAGSAAAEPLGDTATIGRQWVHADPRDVTSILTRAFPDRKIVAPEGFADDLLRASGATRVTSFDVSSYEDATVIHDMNLPLPAEHRQAYDTVIESGSLEHVFDVRTALANVMDMPRDGGRVLLAVPANNLLGHGFYQFSPELYFRAFSAEQGYALERLFLVEYGLRPAIFEVTDPAVRGRRGEMVSGAPVYLLLQARRVEVRPLFVTPLQQSDYSDAWEGVHLAQSQVSAGRKQQLVQRIPLPLRHLLTYLSMVWRLRVHRAGMSRTDALR